MVNVFRRLVVVLVLGVAACAPRPSMVYYPDAAKIGTEQRVFVGTDRMRDADGKFGPYRSEKLTYLDITVSVPPTHVLGQIEFAKRAPDPRKDFLTTKMDEFDSKRSFQRSLTKALRALPPNERETVVYVHGFNNTMADGVYRTAQLVNDFELPGVAVHYSWPSAANPLGYGYDRDSALIARDNLQKLLETIRASGSKRTLVIAHSMGALLAMEVLRQLPAKSKLVDAVFLISPDIDVEVFESQARRIKKLPEPFVIFVSKYDRALALSARLTGQKQRLGTLTDPARLRDLAVTLIDVSAFSAGGSVNHFVTGSSPVLIQILSRAAELDASFKGDYAGRTGLLPGTVLTVQNATQIIMRQPVR